MIEVLEFMFSGFWTFVGCLIILAACIDLVSFLWNRFWRHWNIRKHGYPPPHCDADGDFKNKVDE